MVDILTGVNPVAFFTVTEVFFFVVCSVIFHLFLFLICFPKLVLPCYFKPVVLSGGVVPRKYLAMSEDILLTRRVGAPHIQWTEAVNAAKYPTMHRRDLINTPQCTGETYNAQEIPGLK